MQNALIESDSQEYTTLPFSVSSVHAATCIFTYYSTCFIVPCWATQGKQSPHGPMMSHAIMVGMQVRDTRHGPMCYKPGSDNYADYDWNWWAVDALKGIRNCLRKAKLWEGLSLATVEIKASTVQRNKRTFGNGLRPRYCAP